MNKRESSHKGSCRSCGSHFIPVDACKICKEHIRWICSRCNKSEDVTHKHRESVDDIIIYSAIKNLESIEENKS